MSRLWAYGVSAWFLYVPIAIALGQAAPALRTAMQLAAIAVLIIALFKLRPMPDWQGPGPAIFLAAGAFAFPLLQLIPLPASVWTELAGRHFFTATLEASSLVPTSMPISLSPAATRDSFLAMLPAFALFLAIVTLPEAERRKPVIALLGLGLFSVVLGLAQVSQGPNSPLYVLKDSSLNSAVGLFANRNHFAALLFCCMPFVSAWTISLVRSGVINGLAATLGNLLIYGILVLGLAVAGSRAGLLLAMLAMLGAVLLARRNAPSSAPRAASRTMVLAGAIGTAVIVEFGLVGIMRFAAQDGIDQKRLEIVGTGLRIAADMMPLGSGLGTFVPIYSMYEAPQSLGLGLVNYAHNDWLQLGIEGGLGAVILLGLFAIWYLSRTFHVWHRGGVGLDALLPRAASLVVALLLIHSCVDYPLRSSGLMCVFALACGLMAASGGERSLHARAVGETWRSA